MPIIGLGTDIAEIARFDNKQSERLAKRVLTSNELVQYQQHAQPHRFLAKRFAAKEAASKALGTGIAQGVTFHDFEIHNNELGAPILTVSGQAAQIAQARSQSAVSWLLSLSDEKHYTVATVVLESVG
ncbi:holo-ACP synthase [Saccharobesus litoralis]|uniref:Holo-[acyl-carrier-protein] synthase n=1 Tax=Saccharobesus litoralis TaxID=2172099 RepID=A0A2S0VS89_9ALTE|nr:holo-ACP synthase [Saccharobesus litoralis]AWB67069.1 holo-ACP synthase [Saccharobesus litoralis]